MQLWTFQNQFSIIIVGISILLSHFGVNITAFATAIAISIVVISLAAHDTIANLISRVIILIDTLESTEGILTERGVEGLLNEVRGKSMIFQARWWIESYQDYYEMQNRVNRALTQALKDAGVQMPHVSSNVRLDPENNLDRFEGE